MGHPLPTFKAHPTCDLCKLHAGPESVGLPTRPWDGGNTGKRKAVLMVGKAPAAEEDRDGVVFSGPTGVFANNLYVRGVSLEQHADIYLQNIVRCKLPNPSMAVPSPSWGACRAYLLEDLTLLTNHYDEVILLALGAEAIQALYGKKTSFARFPQGSEVELEDGRTYRLFATYMPTVLLPGGDPSKATAIRAHLQLLEEYVRTGELARELHLGDDDVGRDTRVPSDCRLLSIDIESYGAVRGLPTQRFFHPAKSIRLDGVPRSQLVQTVACSWRAADSRMVHRVYNVQCGLELRQLITDLRGLENPTLLGQNIQFDILYLRAFHPAFRQILEPFGRVRVIDLAVVNFLDSDVRPERSLKALSPLLSVSDFEDEPVNLRKGERYEGPDDPRLWKYNVKDTASTLRDYEILKDSTRSNYGPSSPKLSDYSEEWFSELIWLCVSMSEEGIKHDTSRLRSIHQKMCARRDRIAEWAYRKHKAIFGGKGAGKWASRFAIECAERLELLEDPRLSLTKIKKDIGLNGENLYLFLGQCPKGHPLRGPLRLLQKWRTIRDQISRYTGPMLGIWEPKKKKQVNQQLVGGFAFPTWYAVPTYGSSSTSDDSGGTQQGRITAKGPAVQTSPPEVEACEVSRYPGGAIVRIDESQIELRVPAIYSWDSEMEEDFLAGVSRHAATASLVAGREVDKHKDAALYHLGKTVNFLTAFRGGPKKLQETAQREVGIDMTVEEARSIIDKFYERHSTYRKWQDELIDEACERGYLTIPFVGISRTFAGDRRTVEATYVNTIVNFPVQATAALITLSAQIEAEKWARSQGLRTRLIKNTYDEGVYDVPPDELEIVCEKYPEFYRNPPFLRKILEAGGNPAIPLDCSVDVSYSEARDPQGVGV